VLLHVLPRATCRGLECREARKPCDARRERAAGGLASISGPDTCHATQPRTRNNTSPAVTWYPRVRWCISQVSTAQANQRRCQRMIVELRRSTRRLTPQAFMVGVVAVNAKRQPLPVGHVHLHAVVHATAVRAAGLTGRMLRCCRMLPAPRRLLFLPQRGPLGGRNATREQGIARPRTRRDRAHCYPQYQQASDWRGWPRGAPFRHELTPRRSAGGVRGTWMMGGVTWHRGGVTGFRISFSRTQTRSLIGPGR